MLLPGAFKAGQRNASLGGKGSEFKDSIACLFFGRETKKEHFIFTENNFEQAVTRVIFSLRQVHNVY